MTARVIRPEFRTPEQIRADEEIAADPGRFLVCEVVMSEDAAFAVLDARRRVAGRTGADNALPTPAGSLADQPFLWDGKAYRLQRAAYVGGKAVVEVSPPDAAFAAEVARRIEADRFHTLGYYQGFGFVCFPEDYAKYQG